MKRLKILFSILAFAGLSAQAQTIEDGKKSFYYENFKTAKKIFESILASNPNNPEAAYYLGQVLMRTDKLAEAKSLFQKALTANPGNALLITAIGHAELTEGKVSDAIQRFEAASSITKGKDIAVLNAIALAANSSEKSDPKYIIGKLLPIATAKTGKTAELLTHLGDAYRIAIDGANAKKYYDEAIKLEPNYAKAHFRLGKLFQSTAQTGTSESVFMPYFEKAAQADPNYAPNFFNYYTYYLDKDLAKASAYLDKYIAVAEQDQRNCFYKGQIQFRQKNYQQALNTINPCIAEAGNDVFSGFYGFRAYIYKELKDSINAEKNFRDYFDKTEDKSKISLKEYIDYYGEMLKVYGQNAETNAFLDKALALAKSEADKNSLYKVLLAYARQSGNVINEANAYAKIVETKANPNQTDIFTAGNKYLEAKDYANATKFFQMYTSKFPTEFYGYYYLGNSINPTDTAKPKTWAAQSAYEGALRVADTTTAENKERIKGAAEFAYNQVFDALASKGDKAGCESIIARAKAFDPTMASIAKMESVLPRVTKPTQTSTNTGKTNTAPKTGTTTPKTGPQPASSGTKQTATKTKSPVKPKG